MANNITFGTDGFRGIIAREFTFENVEKITTAITHYLKSVNLGNSVLLVGYDPRFMARDFAEFSANILAKCGHKVLLSSTVCPTPTVAFGATVTQNSGGALMFTASHNPPKYLGVKFIPNYGGPATVEITNSIVQNLETPPEYKEGGSVEEADFSAKYFEQIEKLIDFKKIASAKNLNILYDGLFSASIGYFDELLKRNGVAFESVNTHYDPLFGGGLPEPVKKYMKHSKKGFVTLANDGDADRYGVIDEEGNWVSPNVVMALLLRYLLKRGDKGKLVKTVGASGLLDIVAKKLGVQTVTTPVGFKWVGDAMREHETLLAGEDSGGLSTGRHIPEKDGVFANALILEMLAFEGETLVELQRELVEFAGVELRQDRVDIKLHDKEEIENIKKKFLALNDIAGFGVKDIVKIDGIKLFLNDNASWVLVRESGTEPLLRFYIESDNAEKIENIKKFIQDTIRP